MYRGSKSAFKTRAVAMTPELYVRRRIWKCQETEEMDRDTEATFMADENTHT